jgi:predicted transposase/invertase (TIGR01784 family)
MNSKHLIRFDWAMKRLLRQKSNFVILEGFLSELLKEDIVIEQILESESNQESIDDKFNRVDILALNGKKELVIIEVQNNKQVDYFQRMLYGVAKVTSEYLGIGEKYREIKKVYSVNIVYFDLGQGQDYVYYGKTDFVGIHQGDILELSDKQKELFDKEAVYQLFPEFYVLKVNNFNDLAKDTLDEWVYYLKNDEVLNNSKARGLKEVTEYLRVQNLSDTERYAYYRDIENKRIERSVIETAIIDGLEEGREQGRAEGRAEGRVEGRVEGRAEGRVEGIAEGRAEERAKAEEEKRQLVLQMAKNLKNMGLSNEQIAQTTGLTLTIIETL